MSIEIELLEEEAIVLYDLLRNALKTGKISEGNPGDKEALFALFCGIENYLLPGCDHSPESKKVLADSRAFLQDPWNRSRTVQIGGNSDKTRREKSRLYKAIEPQD